jgi:hypothetical protein
MNIKIQEYSSAPNQGFLLLSYTSVKPFEGNKLGLRLHFHVYGKWGGGGEKAA